MRNPRWIPLSLVAALCAACLPVPAFAEVKPFVRASVASVDAAKDFLTRLGLDLPPLAASIEQSLQIEPGTIDPTKPIGVVIVADRESLTVDESGKGAIVLVLPAVSGKSTPEQIRKSGGSDVIDRDISFSIKGGYFFHRAADDLYIGNSSDHAAGLVDPDVFKTDYSTPGTLAALSINLTALRAAAPDFYKKHISEPLTSMLPPGQSSGIAATIQRLNRFALQVAPNSDNVDVKTWFVPTTYRPSEAHPRPAFPGEIAGEIHVAFASDQAAEWIDGLAAAAGPDSAAVSQALHILAGGTAVSIAIGTTPDKKGAFYVVDQFPAAFDAAAALKQAWPAIAKTNRAVSPLTTYTLDGKTVTHGVIPLDPAAKEHLSVDLLQAGNVAYITIANSDTHLVGTLLAAGMKGQIPAGTLSEGSMDLGKVLAAHDALSSQPAPMAIAMFGPMLSGQVTWTARVDPQSAFVYTDIQIPVAMAKSLAAYATQGMQPHGPAPASPPARSGRAAAAPKPAAAKPATTKPATTKPVPAKPTTPKPAPGRGAAPTAPPAPAPNSYPNRPVDNLL